MSSVTSRIIGSGLIVSSLTKEKKTPVIVTCLCWAFAWTGTQLYPERLGHRLAWGPQYPWGRNPDEMGNEKWGIPHSIQRSNFTFVINLFISTFYSWYGPAVYGVVIAVYLPMLRGIVILFYVITYRDRGRIRGSLSQAINVSKNDLLHVRRRKLSGSIITKSSLHPKEIKIK